MSNEDRAELDELHRYHGEDQDALAEMRATITRLRTEIAEQAKYDITVNRAIENYMADNERMRAIIQRVHSVLDQMPLDDWIEEAFRAALKEPK